MALQELDQAPQSPSCHARLGFLRQLAARDWIEHPPGHGGLGTIGQLHEVELLEQPTYDLHFRSEERMMTILNSSLRTQFMSIMGRRWAAFVRLTLPRADELMRFQRARSDC